MVFASCIDVTPNTSDALLLMSPYFTVDDEPEKDEKMDSSDYVVCLLPAVLALSICIASTSKSRRPFSSNWWYC
jgi:hypothetical protein